MAGASSFGVYSHKEVAVPLADLLAVFLTPELNPRWNSALGEQHLRQSTGGTVAHQVYPLPWPLSNRDFVVKCIERSDTRLRTFYQACYSVDDQAFPEHANHVRGMLKHSAWEFEALPGGRTRIYFESFVDVGGDLPKWIVRAGQNLGSGQLTNALLALQKRLALPPHKDFVDWTYAALDNAPPPWFVGLARGAISAARVPIGVATAAVRVPVGAVASGVATGLRSLHAGASSRRLASAHTACWRHARQLVLRLPPPPPQPPQPPPAQWILYTPLSRPLFALNAAALVALLLGVHAWQRRSGRLAIALRWFAHPDALVLLCATFSLAFLWFARCLPALWAAVHGPLLRPAVLSPYPFNGAEGVWANPNDPSATPFALVSAASHTGAVTLGLAVGEQTRSLPARLRCWECLRTALLFFGGLTLALRLGFEARLPLLHPLACRYFDADATLPFALLGGLSVTGWMGVAMALPHHPLGQQLQRRSSALGLAAVGAASYALDAHQQGALFSGSVLATAALPALAAFCGAAAAATAAATARDADGEIVAGSTCI